MNVTCTQCMKPYSVADDKVMGKTVKIRCKQCSNVIIVRNGVVDATASGVKSPESSSPAPQKAMAPASAPVPNAPEVSEWFVMVKGAQQGPMTVNQLKDKVKSGEMSPRSHIWKQGMGNWQRAQEISEMMAVLFTAETIQSSPAPQKQTATVRKTEQPTDVSVGAQTSTSKKITAKNGNGAMANGSQSSALDNLFDDHTAQVQDDLKTEVQYPAISEAKEAKDKLAANDSAKKSLGDETGPDDDDPFAKVGGGSSEGIPAIGEATRFFIKQSGADNRNPPWKIALFAGCIVGLLASGYYGITHSSFSKVVKYDPVTGKEEAVAFFSSDGLSSLRDRLSGKEAEKKREAESKRLAAQAIAAKAIADAAAAAAGSNGGAGKGNSTSGNVAGADMKSLSGKVKFTGNNDLIGDAEKVDTGPKMRNFLRPVVVDKGSGSIDAETAQKVLKPAQQSFNNCVEQALRKNPNLKAGRVTLTLTIGPSGVVKAASVEPRKFETDEWAVCLKNRAKRVAFPRFEGDEVDLEVPLVVGVSIE